MVKKKEVMFHGRVAKFAPTIIRSMLKFQNSVQKKMILANIEQQFNKDFGIRVLLLYSGNLKSVQLVVISYFEN